MKHRRVQLLAVVSVCSCMALYRNPAAAPSFAAPPICSTYVFPLSVEVKLDSLSHIYVLELPPVALARISPSSPNIISFIYPVLVAMLRQM